MTPDAPPSSWTTTLPTDPAALDTLVELAVEMFGPTPIIEVDGETVTFRGRPGAPSSADRSSRP